MSRGSSRLNVRTVQTVSEPGRHADDGGLFLNVATKGTKSWVFVYRSPTHRMLRADKPVGRTREAGLGSVDTVTLAQARDGAHGLRKQLAAGIDPLDVAKVEPPKPRPTFGSVADEVVASLEKGWRNPKHRAQWRMTLEVYAAPIRGLPVDAITTEHILTILQPIWAEKAETASRLRGRIEKVLDAAKAKGHRSGENPARWRGHLDHLLPPRQKLQRGHHPAMPYDAVPAFISQIRLIEAIGARALEFTILTAARSGEARGARWDDRYRHESLECPGRTHEGGQ